MIRPVILSGGSGTRLWPLSRELYPKQFLPLNGENTMIQDTVLRLQGMNDVADPIIVCNNNHRFLAAEQMREIGVEPEAIILEPVGRNTAPAIAAASHYCINKEFDDILLVLPADHVINDLKTFQNTVEAGAKMAFSGKLVTFGIVATSPETGYGYIKADANLLDATTGGASVERFVEKPDLATAEKYIEDGNYYWNSGMFMFRASDFIAELQKFNPEADKSSEMAVNQAESDNDFVRLNAEKFGESPSISIDYAVMEKTDSAVVIPLDAGWNDIGSWAALSDVNDQDENNNVVIGDVILDGVTNSYVRSSGRLVGVVGLDDHIVVETSDAVLVARKDRVQNVKKLVEQLKKSKRPEALNHLKVNRPWGTYETVDSSERFLVKRITVKPGAKLSLQMHYHRAEHWIVVKGTAKIIRGDETVLLSENQSTYIPLGVKHRLENPGKIG
ncbi:MAG: mannose-1-phosphate guanylyltransferase/mannose-6-phosphate isomerase, partial [Candidatus Rifleibacteriota bacterium]